MSNHVVVSSLFVLVDGHFGSVLLCGCHRLQEQVTQCLPRNDNVVLKDQERFHLETTNRTPIQLPSEKPHTKFSD